MKRIVSQILLSGATSSSQQDHVDPQISRLYARCLGNQKLVDRLIRNFHQSLAVLGPQILSAVQKKDYLPAKALAHRLKGEAANLEALGVCRAATLLERAASNFDQLEFTRAASLLEQAIKEFSEKTLPENRNAETPPQVHGLVDQDCQV